jgi:hypothetical protein
MAEYQKARADAAEASRDQWKQQATDWKALFDSEHQRAQLLQSATVDRKDAYSSQGLAVELLKQQVTDDGNELKSVRSDLRVCQAAKFKWAVLGYGAGVGTGLFVRH